MCDVQSRVGGAAFLRGGEGCDDDEICLDRALRRTKQYGRADDMTGNAICVRLRVARSGFRANT